MRLFLGTLPRVPYTQVLPLKECKNVRPNGEIQVTLKRDGKDKITDEVVLPQERTGTFVWQGKTIPLKGGRQRIKM